MCLSRLWKWKDENRFRIRPTVLLCAMNNRDLENSTVITALTGTNLTAAAKSYYSPAICTIDPPKVHSNVQFEYFAEWIQPFHALRQSKWVHTLHIILLQEVLVKRPFIFILRSNYINNNVWKLLNILRFIYHIDRELYIWVRFMSHCWVRGSLLVFNPLLILVTSHRCI